MTHFVSGSKFRSETVSIIASFDDLIIPGDYIVGTPTITVTVTSGIDPSPDDLLYLGVSVTKGSVVEQRFRLGVEGAIYHINYQVVTHLGDTWEKSCYLAVRPNEGAAIPTWLPLWESTQLYPIDMTFESFSGAVDISGGSLTVIIISYTGLPETFQGAAIPTGGYLRSPTIPYTILPENFQGDVSVLAGTLVVVVIPYTYASEDFTGDVSFMTSSLVVVVIPYSYSSEDFQGTATFTGGTLV